MASIIKKRRGDHVYLYAATSARVDGQPRIVDQVYLGTEEEVLARLTATADGDPTLPAETVHRKFADVAAVWAMLERLDAVAVIDEVLGQTRVPGGVSVGMYLALAALNRVVTQGPRRDSPPGGPVPRWVVCSRSRPERWTTAGSGRRWTG
jgi:hypothetical protein